MECCWLAQRGARVAPCPPSATHSGCVSWCGLGCGSRCGLGCGSSCGSRLWVTAVGQGVGLPQEELERVEPGQGRHCLHPGSNTGSAAAEERTQQQVRCAAQLPTGPSETLAQGSAPLQLPRSGSPSMSSAQYSSAQLSSVWYSSGQLSTAQQSSAQYSRAQYSSAQHSVACMAQGSMILCVAQCNMAQLGTAQHTWHRTDHHTKSNNQLGSKQSLAAQPRLLCAATRANEVAKAP